MARIMVVAGGAWQCPIVRLAKSKGHFVVCTNLYPDSPAFAYADVGVVANVLDREKNLAIARQYRPDAVLTAQSDIAVPTVAYVAEQMGLKGIGLEMANRFTNKYTMREFTSRSGFPSPRFRKCYTEEQAVDFLQQTPVAILKPLDSQSSRGVHIVRSAQEVRQHFADCVQYSNAEKAVLIEEYIEGTEFTVDGIKTPTEYAVTAISEKSHYAHNPNIAKRLLFTRHNDRYDYDKLRKVNTAMVEAMGLPFGVTHAEYKYKDGEFYLIEIAARGGGTKISSDIVPLVSGINSNELLLETLLGGTPAIRPGPCHACAVLGFFDFKPGRVVSVQGIEEARRLPGTHDIGLELREGQVLEKAQDDRSRCGYYILYAESVQELEDREKRLKETVKVVTE